MYARITRYKMKPGTRAEATALQDRLRSEIMGLPGMRHFYNAMAEDGSGYIVSLIEAGEQTADAPDRIKAIWANFSHLLEAAPTPETFEVIADWSR